MTSLIHALPSVLVLIAAFGLYGWSRQGRERRRAWGAVLFAVLLIGAALLAAGTIVTAGWASVAPVRVGLLDRLAASLDAIMAIILSGAPAAMILVGVIVVAAVAWIVCSGEIGRAWAILFPSSRVVVDGPWQGSFLTDS
ncbi:hypothetical protein ASG39_22665, partial [Rhizobium sp. Leaf371]|uniref:hypothetical protein n=1 Tax=Rhizobium sp. Leaf371 TaxID=1736355 RepID=UPI000713E5E6